MFKRASRWNLRAVILIALIAIIMGILYTYAFNSIYNAAKIVLAPTGLAPLMDTIFTGLWLMAGPLAIYFVPTIGSGTIGELLASVVEMAVGGQWGAVTVLSGLLQGAGNEIGFFPKKARYVKFSWGSVLCGAVCSGLVCYFLTYFLYGWFKYNMGLQIAMFITNLLSAVLFDGVLVKLITKMFDRALKPQLD